MGYLTKCQVVILPLLLGVVAFSSAEAPRQYGAGPSAWTMQKAEMVYEGSTVGLEPVAASSRSYRHAESGGPSGWSPYHGTGSATSYQQQTTYQNRYTEPSQNLYVVQPLILPVPNPPNDIASSYQTIPTSGFSRSPSSYFPQSAPSFSSQSSGQSFSAPSSTYNAPAPAPQGNNNFATSSTGLTEDFRAPDESGTSDRDIRFVIHKDGEEEEVKNTLLNEYKDNHDVSFLRGPTFKFEKKQKLFLPPKPKTLVFVLLRMPEVNTETEVVPSAEDPKPEVRIIYQRPEGVKTQHYSPKANQGSVGASPSNGFRRRR